jgi:hypothetical protein
MTIKLNRDSEGQEVAELGVIWGFLLKVGLAMLPVMLGFFVWVVIQIFTHGDRLNLIEWRIDHSPALAHTEKK